MGNNYTGRAKGLREEKKKDITYEYYEKDAKYDVMAGVH